jgi:catechol 2,3-dioxygenase-like lactoylglutathione lyase family enzyme
MDCMKITAFDHIVLCVRDVDRTIEFYRDLLGMEARQERPGKWSLATSPGRDRYRPTALATETW